MVGTAAAMIIERIWGWLPVPKVIAKAHTIDPFAGSCAGPSITIDVRYIDDVGLLAHELTHAKQFYRTAGLHLLLYRFSKRYRYRAEIEAYRAQLATKGSRLYRLQVLLFARFIAVRYDLSVTVDQAKHDLTQ